MDLLFAARQLRHHERVELKGLRRLLSAISNREEATKLAGRENQEDLPIHSVTRTWLTDKRRVSHVSWLFDIS